MVEYGFAPKVTGLSGVGKVDISGPGVGTRPHESDFQTQLQQLNDTQYANQKEKIMADTITYQDLATVTTSWGGSFASA